MQETITTNAAQPVPAKGMRWRYGHPTQLRSVAKAKPRGPFAAMIHGQLRIITPPKIGGERSKYTPHQGKAECARRALA